MPLVTLSDFSGLSWASPVAQLVKNLPANAGGPGDVSSMPGSGRSPRVENGNPLQYGSLESSMDREITVHGVAKDHNQLSNGAQCTGLS